MFVFVSFFFLILLLFRWRTKQNLDYSFLMMYAVSKGVYYVQVRLWRKKFKVPAPLPVLLEPLSLILSLIPLSHVQVSSLFLARAVVQFGCVYVKVVHMQMRAFDTPAPRTGCLVSLVSSFPLACYSALFWPGDCRNVEQTSLSAEFTNAGSPTCRLVFPSAAGGRHRGQTQLLCHHEELCSAALLRGLDDPGVLSAGLHRYDPLSCRSIPSRP